MTSTASTMKKPPPNGPGGSSLWITERQQQTRERWRQLMAQTTEATNYTITVDDDGTKFVELGHLDLAWESYLKLLKQRAELDAGIERAQAFFERHMTDAGVDGMTMNGRKVVTYKKNATFPAAKFAAENPGIAAAYMTTKEVLDVAALKLHRPQDYANWRGRSFKHVQARGA